MAIRYAVANGNWSSLATWDGGVSKPTHGDLVFANNRTVTINENIDIGNDFSVNAGSFITGQIYQITSIGTTNFTLIGASANTVGLLFVATGAGTGTGTADVRSGLTNGTLAAPAITAGGTFTLAANYSIRAGIFGGTASGSTLTISGNSSTTITGICGFSRGAGAHAVSVTTPGTINIIGNCLGGIGTGSGQAITTSAVAGINLNITGDIIGGSSSGGRAIILANTNSTITITGNITGGTNANALGLWITGAGNTTIVNGNIAGATSASSPGVSLSSGNGVSFTVNGNVTGGSAGQGIGSTSITPIVINGNVNGGTGAHGIEISQGSVTVSGTVTGGTVGGIYGVSLAGTSVVGTLGTLVSGSVTGSPALGITGASLVTVTANLTSTTSNVILLGGSGITTLVVNGNVTGSNTNATTPCIETTNTAASSVTINGNVTAGSLAGCPAILGATSGSVVFTINGNVTASTNSSAVRIPLTTATTTYAIVNGNTIDSSNGVKAIHANRWYFGSALPTRSMTVSNNGSTTYTFYGDATWAADYPLEADVRTGTLYGAGDIYEGTCAVPPAASVLVGVPVDATVGTAEVSASIPPTAEEIADAVRLELATELARIDIPVSEATTDISGIPLAVRTELATELARIDVAISTRLSEAGYTEPPTAAAIATAVEAALLNEGDGQQLIDAILQVINTNLDLPALELTAIANAVRSELATELARIDATISSRSTLTAGGVRTELATELARIDVAVSSAGDPATIAEAVRTELTPELARVANCSTVDTTGAQLAAIL